MGTLYPFAALGGTDIEILGSFAGEPCIVSAKFGKGEVIYCGTNLGDGAQHNISAFENFLKKVCERAGVADNGYDVPRGVHTDKISDRIIAVNNTTENGVDIHFGFPVKGVFNDLSGKSGVLTVPALTAEIFVLEGN